MSSSMLRMQHASLQYSDTHKQQRQDVEDLFKHGELFPIKTGTEAGLDRKGNNINRPLLIEAAKDYKHVVHFARDNWIAIDREIIKPHSVIKGNIYVADNDDMVGPGHDRVMATIIFEHKNSAIGEIAIGSVHYATKGQHRGRPNFELNKLYARRIQQWLHVAGSGRALAFVNGDFNMPDRKLDWAFGGKFTSMADELKAWENTGHGPIDGFCSYDRDGRVKAHRFEVLNDREFFQHSDHFVCRGTWKIRELNL